MKTINTMIFGASLLTASITSFAQDVQKANILGVSNIAHAPQKTDIWSSVANDVAKIDGKTMTKVELAKAFALQFPDGKVPAKITQQQIITIAPQFLRQHIQTILLIDLARGDGGKMDAGTAYKQMKIKWKSLSGEQATKLKAELNSKNTTLDAYAKKLASRQSIQNTLLIQNWIKTKLQGQAPVGDADVKKFYNDNKIRLQSADGKAPTFKLIAPQIRAYLENQKVQQLLAKKLAEAEKTRKVQYLLTAPPRKFGGCAPSGCTPTCN